MTAMNSLALSRITPATRAVRAAARSAPTQRVEAALSYLVRGAQRPRSYAFPPPDGEPWENSPFEARVVALQDGRRHAHVASVHQHGFELWDAPSSVADFRDGGAITSRYYAECAELALAATAASRAHVFDHLLRRREPDRAPLTFGRGAGGRAGANGRIHNDYTEASGRRRLRLVIPDERERAGVRRYAIVNIWRSVRGPVLDTPLALCDARTVSEADLVAADVLYPGRTGEIYFMAWSPQHRWTWYPAMDRHEALVFKQYDSAQGVARFTPHAAFDLPHPPADAPPRESIEVRCLVTYD